MRIFNIGQKIKTINMSNLYRAIRKTFKYKRSIIFALICALGVGLLWGGNITVLLPFVELTLSDNPEDRGNLSLWVTRNIDKFKEEKQKIKAKIEDLKINVQIGENYDAGNEKEISKLQKKLSGWGGVEAKISCLEALAPYVKRFTPSDPFWTIGLLVVIVLLGSALKGLVTVIHTMVVAKITGLSIMELRNELYQKVLTHDPNDYTKSGIADAMSRLTGDVGSLSGGLNLLYGKMVREPLKMVACLVLAAAISWQLLVVTLVFVPLAAFLIIWVAKSIKRTVKKALEQGVKVFARLEESLRSIRVVRSFNSERFEYAKFRKTNKNAYQLGLKVAKYGALTNPMTEIMGMLMICCAILAGAHVVIHEPTHLFGLPMPDPPLTLAWLLVFFGALAGAADPARKLSDIFQQFQASTAAADRVYALIDRLPTIRDADNPKRLKKYEKQIEFDHVSFEYEPGRTILKDISLTLRFGETIAIVGPSGCGKSTLMNLIPRFIDPVSGVIRIDDIPLREIKMRNLYRNIGLVSQEPILFNDTVYENIRYGTFFASHGEIMEAARRANAHDFIVNELSDGYNTNVGPSGSLLSGGQRQRIAMARAILHDPGIFLLDEATSQIDMQSEKMIHDAIKDFIGNRTTVIVTHRLGALELADRIIVMKEGRIECVGSHTELLAQSSYYANINCFEQ